MLASEGSIEDTIIVSSTRECIRIGTIPITVGKRNISKPDGLTPVKRPINISIYHIPKFIVVEMICHRYVLFK